MIDNPETLEEKMQNIQELVHQYLPDMPVEWANIRRRLGCCCYKYDEEGHEVPYLIRISRPMAKVNSWDTIKLIVLHEIAHALAPDHDHDSVWKAKCVEIGGSPDVYATDAEDPRPGYNTAVKAPPLPEKKSKKSETDGKKSQSAGKKPPKADKYIKVCSRCGRMGGYASRKSSTIHSHSGCRGTIELLPNSLYGIEDYDPDRIFGELKEKIVPILSSDKSTLGIARPDYNSDFIFILCKKVPSKEQRDEMYKKLQGLYEYCMLSEDAYDGPGVLDMVIVKANQRTLYPVYVTRAQMWKHIENVFAQETGPDMRSFTPKDLASISYAEVLTETDGCWEKLKKNADACPPYVFKKWCKHELEQTVKWSEHYGSSIKYDLWPQLPAFKHLLTAMYYLNRKYDPRTVEFETAEEFDAFEKKPKNFGERYFETFKLLFVKGNGVRIENELKKLVEEIRVLLEEG